VLLSCATQTDFDFCFRVCVCVSPGR